MRKPIPPKELRAAASGGTDGTAPAAPTIAVRGDGASAPQTVVNRAVSEESFPCPACGYDLRGVPFGMRCPECGGVVPKPARPPRGAAVPSSDRERAFDACTMLGWACVAPAALVLVATTLGSVGMASTVCVAMAPLFRVLALSRLGALPEKILADAMPAMRLMRRANEIDLAIAAATVAFAFGSTFGLLPDGSRWFYELLIGAWVLSGFSVLWLQVRLAERLTPKLIDPTELPGDKSPLARKALVLAAALVAASTAIAVVRTALPATALAGTDAWLPPLGAACYALSLLAVLAACILSAVQTLLLGQAVAACDALRTPVVTWASTRDRETLPPDDESPEAIPPERRHAANPTTPDDDSPIPLA